MTLLIVAGFGLLLYVLIFRPLRTAPAGRERGGVARHLGRDRRPRSPSARAPRPAPADRIFPEGAFHLGDVTVSKDRVFVASTIIGIAVVDLGDVALHAVRAHQPRRVAEREGRLRQRHPRRIASAAANWMLSSVIAGIAGILIAPIVAPVPIEYTLFIVPALAVATLGGFQRLLPTVLGGLALGMIQAELVYLQHQHSWIPKAGAAELVPLALILIVLVARAKPLPSRGMLEERRLGRAPRVHSLPRP